ncbi:putative SP-containing protein [Vairimorpha necatrix]|uniref:SP-containing protein n=1 Tax=Vairimorpha necatrix TaxID=6039 RepID=A0AAX4JGS8_9MICR
MLFQTLLFIIQSIVSITEEDIENLLKCKNDLLKLKNKIKEKREDIKKFEARIKANVEQEPDIRQRAAAAEVARESSYGGLHHSIDQLYIWNYDASCKIKMCKKEILQLNKEINELKNTKVTITIIHYCEGIEIRREKTEVKLGEITKYHLSNKTITTRNNNTITRNLSSCLIQ